MRHAVCRYVVFVPFLTVSQTQVVDDDPAQSDGG
jgi:hypothetical protein